MRRGAAVRPAGKSVTFGGKWQGTFGAIWQDRLVLVPVVVRLPAISGISRVYPAWAEITRRSRLPHSREAFEAGLRHAS